MYGSRSQYGKEFAHHCGIREPHHPGSGKSITTTYRRAVWLINVHGLYDLENLSTNINGTYIYKKPKTESSIRDVKLPSFVVDALCEQRKRTWKGNGENFVFVNKEGRHLHRHTLNRTVITPALEKIKTATHISAKDTRAPEADDTSPLWCRFC